MKEKREGKQWENELGREPEKWRRGGLVGWLLGGTTMAEAVLKCSNAERAIFPQKLRCDANLRDQKWPNSRMFSYVRALAHLIELP